MPDFLNGLFFSELLADNAGGSAVNVNGQGGANKQDEYIEIQNNSGGTIDLDGYQLWSDQNGLLHTFGSGDEVEDGDTAVVVGTYNNPPSGFYGANGNNNSASSNGGFLEDGEGNKRDTIYLVDPDGNYIQISYGNPPVDPGGLPAGFPTGGTLQGSGEQLSTTAPNATSILRDADGNLVEGDPTPGTPGVVCFVSGTMIACANGELPVDDLIPGVQVQTKDHGLVTLRAIRKACIAQNVLRWTPDIQPIHVPAGALGNKSALELSPAHRILVSGPLVEMLFSEPEVFVPARRLVGYAGIFARKAITPVTYFHLLFDQHEVIRSNGCWSESLMWGEATHRAIQAKAGWKVDDDFEFKDVTHTHTARKVLKGHEAALLVRGLSEEFSASA